jgi:hypothetical protein
VALFIKQGESLFRREPSSRHDQMNGEPHAFHHKCCWCGRSLPYKEQQEAAGTIADTQEWQNEKPLLASVSSCMVPLAQACRIYTLQIEVASIVLVVLPSQLIWRHMVIPYHWPHGCLLFMYIHDQSEAALSLHVRPYDGGSGITSMLPTGRSKEPPSRHNEHIHIHINTFIPSWKRSRPNCSKSKENLNLVKFIEEKSRNMVRISPVHST